MLIHQALNLISINVVHYITKQYLKKKLSQHELTVEKNIQQSSLTSLLIV